DGRIAQHPVRLAGELRTEEDGVDRVLPVRMSQPALPLRIGVGLDRGDETGADPDAVRAMREGGHDVGAGGDAAGGQEQHMVAQLFPDVAEEMMERRRALAVATGLLALDDQPVEAEVEGGSRVLDRRDLRPDAGAGTLEDRDPGGGGQAEME